ncbi:MAG: 4Fe-4S dicluster domain-containing protein [Thermodesulfobacteriota bacterium]
MITVDATKCSGCSRCQVHCSFFRTGRVGRLRARVKVVKIEDLGLDYPLLCRQCRERYCTRCPEGAIEIGPLGQIIVSATLCNACGACQNLCPIGAIELYQDIPYVCDLCGGEPRCVSQCNLGALRYESGPGEPVSLEKFRKKSRGLSPEQKRVGFVLEQTCGLREEWTSAGGE